VKTHLPAFDFSIALKDFSGISPPGRVVGSKKIVKNVEPSADSAESVTLPHCCESSDYIP
jgi:hypothetical protein